MPGVRVRPKKRKPAQEESVLARITEFMAHSPAVQGLLVAGAGAAAGYAVSRWYGQKSVSEQDLRRVRLQQALERMIRQEEGSLGDAVEDAAASLLHPVAGGGVFRQGETIKDAEFRVVD